MDKKPKCIVITGRPGSGKTTLSDKLSKQLYMPKIGRDEIKEGYVNTFGVKQDLLSKDTNRIVNDIFKKVIIELLESQVSIVVEAAFDHEIWEYFIPDFMKLSNLYLLVCDLDAEHSARRHLERGLANPKREYFHGDKRVSVYRETGVFESGEEYVAPDFSVPKMNILTLDGYSPTIEDIEEFIRAN